MDAGVVLAALGLVAPSADLLDAHYDPSYERAIRRNCPRYRNAALLRVNDVTGVAVHRLARQLLDQSPPRERSKPPASTAA